jgi:hypothetical protein
VRIAPDLDKGREGLVRLPLLCSMAAQGVMELALHGAPPIYLPEPCISQRPEAACQQITGCSTTSQAQGVDDQWIATCHSSESVSEDGWVRAATTQTRD